MTLLEILAAKLGGALDHCFKDSAVSGQKVAFDERPGFVQLLKAIKQDDHFLVWEMSRIDRSMPRQVTALEVLAKRGVNVHILEFYNGEPLDLTSSLGLFTVHLLAAFNEFENRKRGERISEAIQLQKRQGRIYIDQVFYGYKRIYWAPEPKTGIRRLKELQPDLPERALMEECYLRNYAGESVRRIADDFCEKKIKTADGKPWEYHRVWRIVHWWKAQLDAGKVPFAPVQPD